MKYSDPKLHFNPHNTIFYKIVRREPPKYNGTYRGVIWDGYGGNRLISERNYSEFWALFNYPFVTPHMIDEIFADDGDFMVINSMGGYDRVVLPNELKKLIIDNDILSNCLSDPCRFDEEDQKRHIQGNREIHDCIKRHIGIAN